MIATHLLECLGWTLLHSLWQFALLALLYGGLQWLLRGRTPQTRYLTAGLTLLAMLGSSLTTFVWLAADGRSATDPHPLKTQSQPLIASSQSDIPAPVVGVDSYSMELTVPQTAGLNDDPASLATMQDSKLHSVPESSETIGFDQLRTTIEPLLPELVVVWLAGVLLLSLRQLGGLWVVERLRRRCVTPVDQPISNLLETMSRRLGLRRVVTCLQSARLEVPSVVGWLRPVILLPLGLATRLPADQLEAILLHELAHIRRYDYLANGLQIVVETLLFYHPAVWCVSRRIRLEREYCADELAVNASGNRILYVKALATLEDHRVQTPQWAVAANGSDLRRRIERLLGLNQHQSGQNGYWLSGLLVAFLLVVVVAWGRINADDTAAPVVAEKSSSEANEQLTDDSQVPPNTAAQEVPPDLSLQEEPEKEEGILENLLYVFQDRLEASLAPPIPIRRKHEFQVVTADGQPIAGATATFTSMGLSDGSSVGGFPAEILPPVATSDADGKILIDLSKFYESPFYEHLKGKMRQGLEFITLQVDHPDHPPLSASVWLSASLYVADTKALDYRKIVLPEASTIEIRAHRENDKNLLGDLYPSLRGVGDNWSETDDVLTLRRLDLTSPKASRWLRVVHVPEYGQVLFSDLIDLKQYSGNPISIETTLKPGTQITGRLSDEVPRPIKNGRVIAAVYSGPDSRLNPFWGSLAEISAEGTFELKSLPRDENVQLIALCDGWVSQTPTFSELELYRDAQGFDISPMTRRSSQLSGAVYPRLHRATGDSSETVIPMERTASCEVTVVDDQGHPIPDATVTFRPFQTFFRSGTFELGTGWDSFALARAHMTTGKAPKQFTGVGMRSFEATTNQDGVAVISELAGGMTRAYQGRSFPIAVRHPDYQAQDGLALFGGLSINLDPGETGKTTVTLHRR